MEQPRRGFQIVVSSGRPDAQKLGPVEGIGRVKAVLAALVLVSFVVAFLIVALVLGSILAVVLAAALAVLVAVATAIALFKSALHQVRR